MASFDPHHSLYEEKQASKYPHFTHVKTESEKICDMPMSCGGKHGLEWGNLSSGPYLANRDQITEYL